MIFFRFIQIIESWMTEFHIQFYLIVSRRSYFKICWCQELPQFLARVVPGAWGSLVRVIIIIYSLEARQYDIHDWRLLLSVMNWVSTRFAWRSSDWFISSRQYWARNKLRGRRKCLDIKIIWETNTPDQRGVIWSGAARNDFIVSEPVMILLSLFM